MCCHLCGAGVKTQDFLKPEQALYQLNYSFSPLFVLTGLFGISHLDLINMKPGCVSE